MLKPGEASHPESDWNRLPALSLALLLAAGIILARFSATVWLIPLGVLAVSVSALLFAIGRKHRSLLHNLAFSSLIVLCGFTLLRLHESALPAANTGPLFEAEEIGLAGRLLGPPWIQRNPLYGDQLRFYFQAEALRLPGDSTWRASRLRFIAAAPDSGGLELYGNERLAFPAKIELPGGYANPGGFDWREYLSSRAVEAEALVENPGEIKFLLSRAAGLGRVFDPLGAALDLRSALYALHKRLYPDEETWQVASAMLIGARSQVPANIRANFTGSGTVHVLVVSGLHAGFIAAAVYFFFSLFWGRSWAASLITVLAVFLFALTSGAAPPVLRAALMCAFVLLALPLQRTRVLFNSVAAAFALLLLVQPRWLFEAGFQLSFAAVAGIGLLVPPLESRIHHKTWWRNPFKRWLARLVLASFAAQLAITPLVAWYFFRVTPAAFIANLLIVPLAGVAVTAGFLADLTGLFWTAPARLTAWPAEIAIRLMIWLARWFSSLPGAGFELAPPGAADIAFYWLILYLAAGTFVRRQRPAALVLTGLVWLNFHLWAPLAGHQEGKLLVRFLDLGSTEAPVAHLPGGARVLFYPSGKRSGEIRKVREIITPYLFRRGGRKLDWLVLRGAGAEDFSWAWQVLSRFKVGAVLLTRADRKSVSFRRLAAWCGSRGVPLRLASSADTLRAGEAAFYFIGGQGHGAEELIPVISHGDSRIVLAGAASEYMLAGLAERRDKH